ncbi:hypothetical protein [uncultured Pseudodesulfovibrio sp.]|uniref:hypothetical protein n=1 Tax=uncultured Pseudodesulfovibrio sp. TaxID=2035858 RepID=UPI0029C79AF4|nr:hypothetical protein [uncultured Pseudodesulfovibrio sp.]
MLKEILVHPNTPAYAQAAAITFAAWWGGRKVVDYISQRRSDKEFEIANKAFIGCCKAYDILMSVKESHTFERENFDFFVEIPVQLGRLYESYSQDAIDRLAAHEEFFQIELYTAFTETKLFFDNDTADPPYSFLTTRNNLLNKLHALRAASRYVIENGNHRDIVGEHLDTNIEMIEDAVVQIWENIELSDRQVKREEEEGVQYHYMAEQLHEALNDAHRIFPKIVQKGQPSTSWLRPHRNRGE